MFDKTTHIHQGSEGPRGFPLASSVTVKEFKAPTDDSVRLLKEMQEKASEALQESAPVSFNGLKAIISIWQDPMWRSWKVAINYDLNGQSLIFETKIDEFLSRDESIEKLRKDFAEHVTNHFLGEFAGVFQKAAPREFFNRK
jgi:hypothetical protein